MVAHDMNTEGIPLWAAPGPSASRELVQTAANELRLAVRFCTYKEILDLLRTERCQVACIVCGARGGLGATTLAVNLAFSLTHLARGDVALVDLDLQRGDVAAFLNLTPLNSIATIAEAKGTVDEIFLAGTLT